jgi:hypothetical protein
MDGQSTLRGDTESHEKGSSSGLHAVINSNDLTSEFSLDFNVEDIFGSLSPLEGIGINIQSTISSAGRSTESVAVNPFSPLWNEENLTKRENLDEYIFEEVMGLSSLLSVNSF